MKERNPRLTWSIRIIGVAMTLFQFYLAVTKMSLQPMEQRVIHLGFVLVLMFLIYDYKGRSRNRLHIIELVPIVASVASMGYILMVWEKTIYEATAIWYEVVLGVIAIILVIEATRRAFGKVIPIMTMIFIAFAFLGPYLPEPFTHRGFDIVQIVSISYLYPEGMFGVPIGVMTTMVFLFVAFGVIAQRVGIADFITDFALSLFGGRRGGPAKIAVVSSCAFGTISGSGVANVVVDGPFTIPLMVSTGFKPHVAAAIEAVASTGGTFMPPVMAACAFIMATNLSIPYVQVAICAIIPALLYYLSAYIFVDMEAAKLGICGLPRGKRPSLKRAVKRYWAPIPGVILMVILLIRQYPEARSAFYGIVFMVIGFVLYELVIWKEHSKVKNLLTLGTLEDCARAVMSVSVACGSIGIIIGIINLTGFGGKISGILILMAGGSKLLLLVFAMIAAILLGMGITPTAVYILCAGAIVPGLIMAGFNKVAAHFFVLYFGCLGALTPPVALSAYAAAVIAGEDPMRVGWTSFRIILASFIIPYAFAFHPVLVAQGPWWLGILLGIVVAFGVFSIVASLQGYLARRMSNIIVRILLFISGIAIISLEPYPAIGGVILLAIISIRQILAVRNQKKVAIGLSA